MCPLGTSIEIDIRNLLPVVTIIRIIWDIVNYERNKVTECYYHMTIISMVGSNDSGETQIFIEKSIQHEDIFHGSENYEA